MLHGVATRAAVMYAAVGLAVCRPPRSAPGPTITSTAAVIATPAPAAHAPGRRSRSIPVSASASTITITGMDAYSKSLRSPNVAGM